LHHKIVYFLNENTDHSATDRFISFEEFPTVVINGNFIGYQRVLAAGWGSMDWIRLAQDRDQWRAL
jgi:hypothetical protein